MMIFYFINRTNFVGLSTSPKNSEILMSEAAKALKLTLFTVRSLKHFNPRFLPNFLGDPIFFFKILTTGTKGGILPKSDGDLDVGD